MNFWQAVIVRDITPKQREKGWSEVKEKRPHIPRDHKISHAMNTGDPEPHHLKH